MKPLLLTTILLALSSEAIACDWYEVAVKVDHFNSDREWNEDGPLFGCIKNRHNYRYFKNSHGWDSFAYTRTYPFIGPVRFELGAVYGYRDKLPNIGGLAPWATFKVGYEWENVRTECHLLGSSVLACILGVRF